MNTFKKYNTYLLTKQALLWHTRVIQMTLIMLLLNVVFYVVGYNSVNLDKMLNVWRIHRWFFRESTTLYWLLCGLTLLIVWGAFFYRTHAAKNFYPISKWYFHKLAVCLFVPALLFLLIPFTYFKGLSNHAKQIISLEELQEFNTTVQLSRPFLLNQSDDFGYETRIFPKKYKEVSYWQKLSVEHYMPSYLYQGKETKIYDILKKEGASSLDSVLGIFAFRTSLVEVQTMQGGNNCSHFEQAFQYALPLDSLPDFKWSHVKNYAPSGHINRKLIRLRNKEETLPNQREYLDATELTGMIHQWIDHEQEAILETLQKLKKLLDKYQIKNNINPEKNFEYLIANDFHFHKELTVPYFYYEEDDFNKALAETDFYYDEYSPEPLYADNGIGHFFQYLEDDQVSTFIENASTVHFSNTFYDLDLLKTMGYIALAATLFLLYFQWANVLTFVISIPVAGVLIFIGALIHSIIKNIWIQEYFPVHVFIYFILAGTVLIIAILGVKNIWNAYVTNVALTLSYFAWPLWFMVIIDFVHHVFTKTVYNPCEYWPDRVEPFSLDSEPLSTLLWISPYLLFGIWLFFIKRIVAKKEA